MNGLASLTQDVGFAIRSLSKSPGLVVGICLTLALGLGVNLAMFGFLDVVFLRPPAAVERPLIIAAIGIYSTISYAVAQRTHEFGIRSALGAGTRDIIGNVIRESARTVGTGVIVGVTLALVSGRFVASLLYGIEPSDPGVIATVALVLLLVAIAAALAPAWRAARVNPVVALRAE